MIYASPALSSSNYDQAIKGRPWKNRKHIKFLQDKGFALFFSLTMTAGISCKTEHSEPNQSEDTDGIITTGAGAASGLDGTGTGYENPGIFCIINEGDGIIQGVK